MRPRIFLRLSSSLWGTNSRFFSDRGHFIDSATCRRRDASRRRPQLHQRPRLLVHLLFVPAPVGASSGPQSISGPQPINIDGRINASAPGPQHVRSCKRMLKYLYSTRSLGIRYPRSSAHKNGPTIYAGAKRSLDSGTNLLQTFADSDYAADKTRRGTMGLLL